MGGPSQGPIGPMGTAPGGMPLFGMGPAPLTGGIPMPIAKLGSFGKSLQLSKGLMSSVLKSGNCGKLPS